MARSFLFLFSHIKLVCQADFLSGPSRLAEVGWARSPAGADLPPADGCFCCDSCGACSDPTFAVAEGGAASGFSAGTAGAGLGDGAAAGLDGAGGTGFGGGGLSRALPYL